MPLTQEDIPRMHEGVVKSLPQIDSRRELMTSDHAPTSTAPATTITTRSTSNFMANSDGANTPHPNNAEVELYLPHISSIAIILTK